MSQKKEDELRKKLSAFDELEMQHEAKVNDMYQQLKGKDERIVDAEEGRDEAEAEVKKLKDLLDEADQSLKMLEERIEPLQEENDQLVQRFEQNEALVQSVKQDFQQILNYKNDLELLIEDQTQ